MSSNVRRRRRTVEERLGAAVRHLRPGDLAGRSEPLPRDRTGTSRVVAGPGAGGDLGTHVEHVTLAGVTGQDVADGGSEVRWSEIAPPPVGRRGFETLAARVAADGEVSAIPIDVTGELEIVLAGKWGVYPSGFKCSGDLAITHTRDGDTTSRTYVLSPPTRQFDGTSLGWEVRAGDTITITVPNESGATQTLTEATVELRVIAQSPAASTVPQPAGLPSSWNFHTSNDGSTLQVPANTQPGELLIASFNAGGATRAWDPSSAGWTLIYESSDEDTSLWRRAATGSDTPGGSLGTPNSTGGASSGDHFSVLRVPGTWVESQTPVEQGEGPNSIQASVTGLGMNQLGIVYVGLSSGFSSADANECTIDQGAEIYIDAGESNGQFLIHTGWGLESGTVEVGFDEPFFIAYAIPMVVEL